MEATSASLRDRRVTFGAGAEGGAVAGRVILAPAGVDGPSVLPTVQRRRTTGDRHEGLQGVSSGGPCRMCWCRAVRVGTERIPGSSGRSSSEIFPELEEVRSARTEQ